MDSKQRKEFGDTLCSLESNNIQNDIKLLMNKVVFPRYLYRYRDVTFNNMEALRTNHCHSCSLARGPSMYFTLYHSLNNSFVGPT